MDGLQIPGIGIIEGGKCQRVNIEDAYWGINIDIIGKHADNPPTIVLDSETMI